MSNISLHVSRYSSSPRSLSSSLLELPTNSSQKDPNIPLVPGKTHPIYWSFVQNFPWLSGPKAVAPTSVRAPCSAVRPTRAYCAALYTRPPRGRVLGLFVLHSPEQVALTTMPISSAVHRSAIALMANHDASLTWK